MKIRDKTDNRKKNTHKGHYQKRINLIWQLDMKNKKLKGDLMTMNLHNREWKGNW